MSVNAETPIASSTANGVTTSFPYAFTVLSAADLVVQGVLSGITTVYTYGVHYTLTGLGTDAGSVEFLSPPANGTVITRYRSSELKRTTDYQDNGDLLAHTVNADFDRLWLALQELASGASGAPGSAEQLAALLAASTGSSRIGHILNAAGAVERTVQSKLRDTVSVLDFGAVGDGIADDSTALIAALASGKPLDFGSGTYKHTGLTIQTPGNLYWAGRGARLNYTGTGVGVWITTAPSTNVADVVVQGITFSGGQTQLRVKGDSGTKAIISRVRILQCQMLGTPGGAANAGLFLSYLDDVEVAGTYCNACTDNGIYTEFCKHVRVHHNVIKNCAGSGGITAAYSDTNVPWMSQDVEIDSNIIFNDDSATAAAYIGGIDVGFLTGARVTNNVIANHQTAPSSTTSIKTGIVVDEWQTNDVTLSGNTVWAPFENFVRVGTDATADIRRLKIVDNSFYNCGLQGIRIDSCNEGLVIAYNVIDTTQQDAIWTSTGVAADTKIHDNSIRHPCIQAVFATYGAIKVSGLNASIENNHIDSGHIWISVTSAVTLPGVSIDPSTNTITLYSNGGSLASTNYTNLTFGQVAEWIRTQANWDATLYAQASAPYAAGTSYVPNQVVTSGGLRYRNIFASIGATPVPSWVSGATYALNAQVLYAGTVYVSLQNANTGNTPLMSPAWWTPLTLDAWSSGTTYPAGTTVTYAGGIFQSMQAGNLNHLPSGGSPWWQLGAYVYWRPMAIDGVGSTPCVPYLRRTGERSGSVARIYAVPAAGLKLTSYETYLAIYTTYSQSSNCKVRGNTLNSAVWEYLSQNFGTVQPFYVGYPYLFQAPDTLADVQETGGGRSFAGSKQNSITNPTLLPANQYYLPGDTFMAPTGATGPTRWTCIAGGLGSAAVWAPLYATAAGYTGGLGAGGYTELTVTVTGALLANENRVVVLTDAASQQGQQIWGYVSADNTVNVAYYNPRGGAFTLAAHTLHVYVYPGPMASPT